MPYLAVVGLACRLMVVEPDLGTAMVLACAVALLVAAAWRSPPGAARRRDRRRGAARDRVRALPDGAAHGLPQSAAPTPAAGFQAIQAKIALGSGGFFGVGLGQSLQKAFYLPEAHTDMIAAVVGEELGLVGIAVLVGLFGLFGYAGFRTAQRARDRYGKLLAAGLTSLILVQAVSTCSRCWAWHR